MQQHLIQQYSSVGVCVSQEELELDFQSSSSRYTLALRQYVQEALLARLAAGTQDQLAEDAKDGSVESEVGGHSQSAAAVVKLRHVKTTTECRKGRAGVLETAQILVQLPVC